MTTPWVQVTDTASQLNVIVGSSSDSSAAAIFAQTQYNFSALIKSGALAGQSISGILMLKADTDRGATALEGRLIPAPATGSTGTMAAIQAEASSLRDSLESGWSALRHAYKADIEVLAQALRAAMAAGASPDGSRKRTAAQLEALQRFKTAFDAPTKRYHEELASQMLETRARLAALGLTPARKNHDNAGDDGMVARGYEVKGTITPAGVVDLSFGSDEQVIVHATGERDAQGNVSGAFVGPAGRQGTWTATLDSL